MVANGDLLVFGDFFDIGLLFVIRAVATFQVLPCQRIAKKINYCREFIFNMWINMIIQDSRNKIFY